MFGGMCNTNLNPKPCTSSCMGSKLVRVHREPARGEQKECLRRSACDPLRVQGLK